MARKRRIKRLRDRRPKNPELKSTGYELFILLLSLVSVLNLVIVWIDYLYPISELTLGVIQIINAIITIFFLYDFAYRLFTARSKSEYFFKSWGWTDLLACVPQLRIFRIFRVLRAIRLLRLFGVRNMINEIVNNRAGVALFITIISIIVIAEFVGVFVLKVESASENANILTAGDAVWWIFVTMTTVGYGDRFPVTMEGRVLAVFVMLSGVALIGVLASFLSNLFLVSPPPKEEEILDGDDAKVQLREIKKVLGEQIKASEELKSKIERVERSI